MLRELKLGIKKFPRLFLADNQTDADIARENGLPYLIIPSGEDEDWVVKCLLLSLAEKMMPGVDWAKLWGITRSDLDWCEDGTTINAAGRKGETAEYSVKKYLATTKAKVDLEELEALKLLPKFLADITDCIRLNLADLNWQDGYNRKLGLCCGSWNPTNEAGSLIILDISASIPVGISSTMLYLIDTLRHRTNAELIITGGSSMYWSINDPLPTPQEIRKSIPRSNESSQFQEILRTKISGRHWGNVISFGDDDDPWWASYLDPQGSPWINPETEQDVWVAMEGTVVDHLWSYHTWARGKTTGYARCLKPFAKEESFDCSWCKWVKR